MHLQVVQRTANGTETGGRSTTGVSLIELLCVITIITILAALMLPAVMRAYLKVQGMSQEMEADEVFHLLTTEARRYCAANPQYVFSSKEDFVDKCGFAPKPRNWVQFPATVFAPFSSPDNTNKIVLTFYIGPKHKTVYSFNKGELTITPPPR
jgi:prepilin-type N-terminal cleavage/methylation domain-containing protein